MRDPDNDDHIMRLDIPVPPGMNRDDINAARIGASDALNRRAVPSDPEDIHAILISADPTAEAIQLGMWRIHHDPETQELQIIATGRRGHGRLCIVPGQENSVRLLPLGDPPPPKKRKDN